MILFSFFFLLHSFVRCEYVPMFLRHWWLLFLFRLAWIFHRTTIAIIESGCWPYRKYNLFKHTFLAAYQFCAMGIFFLLAPVLSVGLWHCTLKLNFSYTLCIAMERRNNERHFRNDVIHLPYTQTLTHTRTHTKTFFTNNTLRAHISVTTRIQIWNEKITSFDGSVNVFVLVCMCICLSID